LSEHIALGIEGEEQAAQHLQDQHYKILARNWRYKRAEIDIIAMHQGTLVFVEVKTRSGELIYLTIRMLYTKKLLVTNLDIV